LVNALCRPVLAFAAMPVWDCDFAPHDVGRYPYATGQVYAARKHAANGAVHPPYYLYPAGTDVYDFRYQMPVEECGNMLIMLEAAMACGADAALAAGCLPILEKWVRYLDQYGEDPGDQLCTDDFAGHLSHNINLAAKAIVGVACYARIMRRFGREEEARRWEARAHEMAASWLERARGEQGTALTFDGSGWSMKYNLAWDLALGLELMPASFYQAETESYLPRVNEYGLPLDSRADYTKSDWLVWTAAMAADRETFGRLIAPLAHYLRTTSTRVPFSDWYDTKTGRYVAFIARSVQGGVYMPLLTMGAKA
ncbi:MAG: glutaminase domain-containing protein, partial [Aristaeellaceae bacterium]